ncbi:MAG TPA: hypothetical protein VMU26_05080 [Candidatus Polarisedimenticolia bacterium]|nr:hypothetical protein [Candidatus Polarisedimenticolia bacterium]
MLFYFDKSGRMVLLHGFIKKTRKNGTRRNMRGRNEGKEKEWRS